MIAVNGRSEVIVRAGTVEMRSERNLLMMLSEAGLLVILGRLKSRVWAIWNHEL
jgi:hypothetical protein